MTRPVALVTGGSRGIGRAVCAELGSTHHILVGGTRPESVADVVSTLPSAESFVADLTDADATAAACSDATRREQWRRVFEVNVIAVMDLTETVIDHLRASRGIVIAVNSGSGFRANPGDGLYPASKFALRAWTDALRGREMGKVRVTSIHPGRVDTDMQHELVASEGGEYDPAKYLDPRAVAETVRLAVDTDPRGQINELSIRPFH